MHTYVGCIVVTVTSRDSAKLSPADACQQCDKDTTGTQCITKKRGVVAVAARRDQYNDRFMPVNASRDARDPLSNED